MTVYVHLSGNVYMGVEGVQNMRNWNAVQNLPLTPRTTNHPSPSPSVTLSIKIFYKLTIRFAPSFWMVRHAASCSATHPQELLTNCAGDADNC
jgi:hypothetical protein